MRTIKSFLIDVKELLEVTFLKLEDKWHTWRLKRTIKKGLAYDEQMNPKVIFVDGLCDKCNEGMLHGIIDAKTHKFIDDYECDFCGDIKYRKDTEIKVPSKLES